MGFSLNFDNIQYIHSLAVAHARRHGDTAEEDMARENLAVMLHYGWMAVAEGKILPADDLIYEIYVAVTADYSLSSGEWIEIQGWITLQDMRISRARFMKIPDALIARLSTLQDSTWRFRDPPILEIGATLEAGDKYNPAIFFCPGRQYDDPLLIVVVAEHAPFELDAFMKTADAFQATLAIVVDHVYQSLGHSPMNLTMKVTERL